MGWWLMAYIKIGRVYPYQTNVQSKPTHNKQGWFTSACLLNRYIPVLGSMIPVVVSYFIPVDFNVRPIVLV